MVATDPAVQRLPDERRVLRLREERRSRPGRRASRSIIVTSPRRAALQRAAREVEDARRTARQQIDQARQIDRPSSRTSCDVADRERRLEADHAERREVELDVLLVDVMRRVIGGDRVDGAVGDPFDDRLAVLASSAAADSSSDSSRTTARPRRSRAMWCGVTSHVTRTPALRARGARHRSRRGREMRDVHVRLRQPRQDHVARDQRLLRRRRDAAPCRGASSSSPRA